MSELTIYQGGELTTKNLLDDFGAFLRLRTANGDASEHTLRSYRQNVAQFVQWCNENAINPAATTSDNILAYRQYLIARYGRATVGTKLQAVCRFFEAATWHGLRQDNPAAGIKSPKDKTARSERVKFLPLDGLRRLLDAPQGQGRLAVRDRAILALMGRHGLRVSEVAGLDLGDVDLDAGTLRVTGKGRKTRTIYLTEASKAVLAA